MATALADFTHQEACYTATSLRRFSRNGRDLAVIRLIIGRSRNSPQLLSDDARTSVIVSTTHPKMSARTAGALSTSIIAPLAWIEFLDRTSFAQVAKSRRTGGRRYSRYSSLDNKT